jgi:hypothetical protein
LTSNQRFAAVRRPILAFLVAAALFVATAGTANAAGAGTTTDIFIGGTNTIDTYINPCTGESGTVEITFNGVFHETDRPNGTFSIVSNIAGTFVLTLDSGDVITGHFASVSVFGGGENDTVVATLNATGVASDGSPFTLHFLAVAVENGFNVTVVNFAICA